MFAIRATENLEGIITLGGRAWYNKSIDLIGTLRSPIKHSNRRQQVASLDEWGCLAYLKKVHLVYSSAPGDRWTTTVRVTFMFHRFLPLWQGPGFWLSFRCSLYSLLTTKYSRWQVLFFLLILGLDFIVIIIIIIILLVGSFHWS